jgi:hypothetical protein
MKLTEFSVPKSSDLTEAERLIEQICSARGLTLTMKGTQATYPGSVHWHYKKPQQTGTLELTLHLAERRIWAKVSDGRRAPWIEDDLPKVRKDVERALRAG